MKFMHAQGIAHRNPKLCGDAIMYDPTYCYPEGFHPVVTKMNRQLLSEAFNYSRTEKPVTYYFADLRTAKRYHIGPTPYTTHHRTERRPKRADEVKNVMDYPLRWKDNFAPEFMTPERKCDPFKVDIFLLGVEISRRFLEVRGHSITSKREENHGADSTDPLQKYRGFEWLRPLIDDMCREDPALRITAAEAYIRFLWLSASVNSSDLDGRLISQRKREMSRRVIRRWRKLHVRVLSREMGLRDDGGSTSSSLVVGVSWLPVHSA
jgi:serine/threonine protein kinase